MKITLQPGQLSLDQLQRIHAGGVCVELHPDARAVLRASQAVVQAAADGDDAVYGVNTGFGKLANQRISKEQLATLQLNLIRSHSVGVGEPLAAPIMRLMMVTKAASLARGYSGVREVVVDTLLAVVNAGLVPFVPSQGSVGASGDLAPLSHMSLALLGEGFMLQDGRRVPALQALQQAGIAPLQLAAKEGLALINGTQTSTALALHALLSFEPVLESALVIGALTVDAARGSDGPFDPRIHAVRGQPGQIDVAQYYRALLSGSAIRASHAQGDDRVQDPYCLRCQPQVVGACLDQMRHSARILLIEANAVTDNPLVFSDTGAMDRALGRPEPDRTPSGGSEPHSMGERGGSMDRALGRPEPDRTPSGGSESHAMGERGGSMDRALGRPEPDRTPSGGSESHAMGERGGSMISGGNFHAEPVALAADGMALAIAEVGAIAERRIAMLIDASVSRLPPFLCADAGLNSGFMIAHVTAAALASENKSLAHPASVDSLPTSANQEDHVSMATFAARRLQAMIANTAHILGIELLASAQGIDFLRPLHSSDALEQAHALLRAQVPRLDQDRYLAPDIEAATALVHAGALSRIFRSLDGLPVLWEVAL